MRYENLGPVCNEDGSPTDLTRNMLAGTGRDPDEFAAKVAARDPLHALRDENGALPAWAWPGGYPIVYVTKDGLVVCAKCAEPTDCSDPAIAYDVFYEGDPIACDDCGVTIESAYGPIEDDDPPPDEYVHRLGPVDPDEGDREILPCPAWNRPCVICDPSPDEDGEEDGSFDEYVSRCIECGEPVDYCQDHRAADPIWDLHDDGDHSQCHPLACDEAAR
jgi:hypothetical protein